MTKREGGGGEGGEGGGGGERETDRGRERGVAAENNS